MTETQQQIFQREFPKAFDSLVRSYADAARVPKTRLDVMLHHVTAVMIERLLAYPERNIGLVNIAVLVESEVYLWKARNCA